MARPEIETEEQNHICSEINLDIARVAREAIRKNL